MALAVSSALRFIKKTVATNAMRRASVTRVAVLNSGLAGREETLGAVCCCAREERVVLLVLLVVRVVVDLLLVVFGAIL